MTENRDTAKNVQIFKEVFDENSEPSESGKIVVGDLLELLYSSE